MERWLAYFGYIFSWIIILLHAVYIGNGLIYKVDNLLVLAQTFYFFQFVNLFTGNYLSQFYYGWRWSHGGFFTNFWGNTVPAGYHEISAPEPYKLISLDAVFIRNAGFSLSLFAVFLIAWAIICLIVLFLNKSCCRKEFLFPSIMKNSLIAGIEFFSMNIFYWSVAHLLYSDNALGLDEGFYSANNKASVAFIVIYSAYAVIRFVFFNKIGGLYMFKRLLIATILAAAVYRKGGYVAIILALEFVFMIVRFIIERPKTRCEKIYIILEWLIYSLAYVLMFFVLQSGVTSFICLGIIFIMVVILFSDLLDVYLNSESQFAELVEDKKDKEIGPQISEEPRIAEPESDRKLVG